MTYFKILREEKSSYKQCLLRFVDTFKKISTVIVALTSCSWNSQETGRSSATSVVCRSPRRETCYDTSNSIQVKNPSNAPSAATPAGGAMPSLVICALMLVSVLLLSPFSSLFTCPLVLTRRDFVCIYIYIYIYIYMNGISLILQPTLMKVLSSRTACWQSSRASLYRHNIISVAARFP